MSNINIFKLDNEKEVLFRRELGKLKRIAKEDRDYDDITVNFELYISQDMNTKEISWNWIVKEFGEELGLSSIAPKGILIIKKLENIYVLSFGHAFFIIDKFCDKDMAFDFAKRIKFAEIKTTTLISPQSKKNKTINTFVNYNQLEFDSGESFSKLKVKIKEKEYEDLLSPTIEIGTSIKFNIKENNIDNIMILINLIEETLNNDVQYQIPLFNKIKDYEKIEMLEYNLKKKIVNSEISINLSELDIIGATEIFNRCDGDFEIIFKGKRQKILSLSIDEIKKFMDDNRFDYKNDLLDVKVRSYYEGKEIRTDSIHNLIDYTDDEERCLLTKGNWFYYNDDYLEYLDSSLKEIECKYSFEYDFTDEIYNNYIENLYEDRKKEYENISKKQAIQKLKKKFYRERVFNNLRANNDNFINYDRQISTIGQSKIEFTDLFKEETMYAVKIGNTSSKLCYVVDQSIESAKLYKQGYFENIPSIKRVAIWIVLDKREKLPLDVSGEPDLTQLNLLLLKTKIASWKSEIRLLGYTPIIYINYTKN